VVSENLRTVVGAHYGLRDWLAQRVTAIVITVYTILLLAMLLWYGRMDYGGWQGMFRSGAFRAITFVFALAVFYHAWVGMRNILMDYIKPTGVRLTLQVIVICVLLGYVGWTIQILWGGPA
jgi:succinate dehydrogenase / fumarate reductase, membrane anchor subunit